MLMVVLIVKMFVQKKIDDYFVGIQKLCMRKKKRKRNRLVFLKLFKISQWRADISW